MEKVFIYFNISKKLFSIRSVATGRVIGYSSDITLKHVSFKVSAAGRKRVLAEKRKNVHAGVSGFISEEQYVGLQRVSYNPYKNTTFIILDSNTPIYNADFCRLQIKESIPFVTI